MFKKLLVPLDGSLLSEQALGVAGAIAKASDASLDLALVHQPMPFRAIRGETRNVAQWRAEDKYLDAIIAELRASPGVPATHNVLGGDPVDGITSRAFDIAADLIVMTSHGRTGINRAWLGSVTEGVVRRATKPVLVLHAADSHVPRGTRLFNRILVTLDGSALSADILEPACDLARCSWARLLLLRVVPPVPMITADTTITWTIYPSLVVDEKATQELAGEAREEMAEVARQLVGQGFREVEPHVIVAAQPAQAIIDFARRNEVDLVAMATHGRGASRLLLGSVTDKVLRASGLPVLIRHPLKVSADWNLSGSDSIAEPLGATANA